MEYSVYDLIKILLRKWYIILISMCLLGGASVIISQKSYEQNVENYEAYTAPPEEVIAPTGDTIAQYRYTYKLTDISRYLAEFQTKDSFFQMYAESVESNAFDETTKPTLYTEAAQAFNQTSADFTALLTDSLTMQAAQAALDNTSTAVTLANCLTVAQVNASTLKLTVTELDESTANIVLDKYIDALVRVGAEANSMEISMEQTYYSYYTAKTQDTSLSDLSQTVMQEPTPPSGRLQIIGTAASFAFLLSCFGILLYTFIQDTKADCRRKTDAHQISEDCEKPR